MAFYKATKIIDEAIKRTKNAKNGSVLWTDRWYGFAGNVVRDPTYQTPLDNRGVVAVHAGTASTLSPPALTWTEAMGMAKKIDLLYVGADHLDVKRSVAWQQIYQVAKRNVTIMSSTGTLSYSSDLTVPCHNCGVVIPFEFLQVDHFMPQAGGDQFHLLKLLRALGCTTAAPSVGGKGSQYLANQNLIGLVLHPKGRDRTYNHLKTPSAAAKWSTNVKGEAFLSVLKYVNAYDDAARMCKNSLLNLVPLCPECNRVKSDWVRAIV